MNQFEKIIDEAIERLARDLAFANGHKNLEEEIVLKGGRREPVWKFYVVDAEKQFLT